MSKILLINPLPAFSIDLSNTCPPLGILYIASYLQKKGHQVKVLDLMVEPLTSEDFNNLLDTFKPDLVGISCCTEAVNAAVRICYLAKEKNPSCKTVLGGPHPTFDDINLVKLEYVDFVVKNEGELTMEELASALAEGQTDFSGIKGLTWKSGNQVRSNESREFIKELDTMPYPARELTDLSKYAFPGSISSSRGCPRQCIFCCAGSMSGSSYRYRKPVEVVNEMKYLYEKFNIRDFRFTDDTFTVKPQRATEICNLIQQKLPGKIIFSCESRVDVANLNLFKALKKAGCITILFGIESGCDEILKHVKKGITTEQIRFAIKTAHEAGLLVKGSIMVGLPMDTGETITRTINFIKEMQDKYDLQVYCGVTTPFPGTPIYEQSEQYQLKLTSDNWDDFTAGKAIINYPHLSSQEIDTHYKNLLGLIMPKNQEIWHKAAEAYGKELQAIYGEKTNNPK